MTWMRTDDGFPEHPKADALAAHFDDDWATLAVAFTTWHHMACDCAARETDGVFLPARAHRVIRAPREVIDKALDGLVAVGLLERKRGEFTFHDWADYQPTREQLVADRKAKAERQARWRSGKQRVGDARVDASTAPSHDASTSPSVTRLETLPRPVPSRPVPSREEEEKSAQAREASPSGGSPSGAHSLSLTSEPEPPEQPAPTKPAKAKRPKPAPPPDVVPAPGTLARRVYDAIVTDRVLGPITGNPGDASERWADPATFPGVDVLAEVRRAGEYAATRPGQYTDGRAFLRKWLQTCADRKAAAPRAHSPHRPSTTADDREAHITVLRVTPKTAEEHEREQREIAANRAEFRRKLEALKAAEAAKGGDA